MVTYLATLGSVYGPRQGTASKSGEQSFVIRPSSAPADHQQASQQALPGEGAWQDNQSGTSKAKNMVRLAVKLGNQTSAEVVIL